MLGRAVTALAGGALLAAATPAWACNGRDCVRSGLSQVTTIEPPPPDLFLRPFERTGDLFQYDPATNLFPVAAGGVVTYAAPFSFNTGSPGGASNMLYIKEDGVVAIGQALAGGGFTPVTDLGRLGVPVIAPFYADLNAQSRAAIGAGFPGIVIQQGLADPFADASGAFSLADAKTALRITWYGFDEATQPPGAAPVYTQLLLIDEGGGDFDFTIRAGMPGSGAANSPAGGLGGFVFGDNNYQYATPYTADSVGTFAVRGGEIGAAAAAVPEPAGWAMLIAGIGLVGGLRRRRPSRRSGVAVA